jgi:DNA-binding transcriptional ArsR family regulator
MPNRRNERGEDIAGAAQAALLLADATRLRLLLILSASEWNVTSLCDQLRLPQPAVSHHLGLLRRIGFVTTRKEGKKVFYAVAEPTVPNTIRVSLGDVRITVNSPGRVTGH